MKYSAIKAQREIGNASKNLHHNEKAAELMLTKVDVKFVFGDELAQIVDRVVVDGIPCPGLSRALLRQKGTHIISP